MIRILNKLRLSSCATFTFLGSSLIIITAVLLSEVVAAQTRQPVEPGAHLSPQQKTHNLVLLLEARWESILRSDVSMDFSDVNVIACGRILIAASEFAEPDVRLEVLLESISGNQVAGRTFVPDWLTSPEEYRKSLGYLADPSMGNEDIYGTQRGKTLAFLAFDALSKLRKKNSSSKQ